ncbi:Mitochondrial succinate-fumarate transporter [Friedmanniomyces endolithicus]|uniref:Mitochondrial succinate-fumarate transporter n=1 Tax=Friedmanniomyces endolithicus TaxID=329885 RepID=A0AAN6KV20_9PEZI|nr:Mitochondrial succinate-fumarate transporter [Friedmanniomyces endolithicus]KAK0977589.1 Mitochondrial succinate-fumarate transporter [Friedmanniomyces endolithicus]KAK1003629.1 Mitochondrial succinate-fumarate transporter [Friedmanniomyces endolithicus]KAK1028341.1 Mitochondrial succinate-fumarate transporter [Friedmanniomyces endolithicus]
MSAKSTSGPGGKKPASVATNLIAGGGAGAMEALACHPLDTIKVRMQLSRRGRLPGLKRRGFIKTGMEIARKETPLGLYKGLGAVLTGIVPKMACRFTSYEQYKLLLSKDGQVTTAANFWAGLFAGVTEAVSVVCPMEVVKIRLQAQHHSMADPLDIPKYRNAAHACYTVVKEEGVGALYRGVTLTALRQGTNQAANFTAYTELKDWLQQKQDDPSAALPGWKTAAIGLVSGAVGPFTNAPIDTIKTRLQRSPAEPGQTAVGRITAITNQMMKQEGLRAFWMGITPRVMRVAPGQAVTFAVYEYLKGILEKGRDVLPGGQYEE